MPRLAAIAAVTLLAGCAQPLPLPPGPTEAEVRRIVDEQNAQWWKSMFPGEPQPVVEVVEYVDPSEQSTAQIECIDAAHIEGVTVRGNGIELALSTATTQRQFNLVQFECALKYPFDPAKGESIGYLSKAQLDYLWSYFTQRLVPCLRLIGYRVSVPSRASVVESLPYLQWTPYNTMNPTPSSPEEWQRIDARCPPPPLGSYWRPGEDGAGF